MKEMQIFPKAIYQNYLTIINEIHFTNREIDVIACLLNARRASKIASLLSIDIRTVETHIRNIMSKLECNSRESIIDFIEASNKITLLRNYYSLLKISANFEKLLKDVSKLNKEKPSITFLSFKQDNEPLVPYIKRHLELVGITLLDANHKKEGKYTIFFLPKASVVKESSFLIKKMAKNAKGMIFISQESDTYKEIFKYFTDYNIIDFSKEGNYYTFFFALLKKLLPDINFDKTIADFNDKYMQVPSTFETPTIPSKKVRGNLSVFSLSKNYFLYVLLIIGIASIGYLPFHLEKNNCQGRVLQSDLIIPKESILVDRSNLIAQINNIFKKKDNNQLPRRKQRGMLDRACLRRELADNFRVIFDKYHPGF